MQSSWLVALLLLWQLSGLAQAPNWQLSASQQVLKMGGQVRITYQLQQQRSEDFEAPAFADWQVVEEPAANHRQRQTFSYVLRPKYAGSLQVPAARVKLKGKWYESNRLVIEVLDKTASDAAADDFAFDAYVLGPQEQPADKIKQNLYVKAVLSKNRCYEGESIVAEYKLYTRVNIEADITKPASFQGFRSVELPRPASGSPYQLEKLNGKTFRVYLLRRVQLIPLQSGRLTLGSMGVQARISFVPAGSVGGGSQPPPTAAQVSMVRQALLSEPATVDVLPLPSLPGADSSSIPVGSFAQQCQLLADSGGGPLLTIAYSGSGHWPSIPVPQVQWPAGVTAFEPTLDDKLDSQAVPISGQRVYGFRFSADTAIEGKVLIKGLLYFDADSGQYRQLADTLLPLRLAAPRSVAASTLAADAPLPATEWFTRYAPLLALAVAGSMLLVLLLRRSMSRRRRRLPPTEPATDVAADEAAAAMWQTTGTSNSSKPVAQLMTAQSMQAVKHEMVSPSTAKETAAQQRQTLLRLLEARQWWQPGSGPTGLAAQQLPAPLLQQIQQWLQQCQLACYSPLLQQADWDQLAQEYEALMDALAKV
ncbi:MAG: BatD family protein [Chitinophagaceae bacterium]|nr:BatD family protein [Chitinophagaceae bacterium]